jgi:hypothetical protein
MDDELSSMFGDLSLKDVNNELTGKYGENISINTLNNMIKAMENVKSDENINKLIDEFGSTNLRVKKAKKQREKDIAKVDGLINSMKTLNIVDSKKDKINILLKVVRRRKHQSFNRLVNKDTKERPSNDYLFTQMRALKGAGIKRKRKTKSKKSIKKVSKKGGKKSIKKVSKKGGKKSIRKVSKKGCKKSMKKRTKKGCKKSIKKRTK